MCKGPGVGRSKVYSGNLNKASMVGVQGSRERLMEDVAEILSMTVHGGLL